MPDGMPITTEVTMAHLITGLFSSRPAAELAVDRLMESGFSRDDISVLMSDATRGREFAMTTDSKAPEGAATGAALGGVLGAIAAGLVSIGIIALPGIGLVAAGPIIAALAGAGAGGAAGGVLGALVGAGIPEHEAKFFSEQIEQGGILVGVYAHDDRADLARELLASAGAESVRNG
jgi:hypothetical protein